MCFMLLHRWQRSLKIWKSLRHSSTPALILWYTPILCGETWVAEFKKSANVIVKVSV